MLRKDIKKHQETEDKVHLHLALDTFCLLKEHHTTLSEGDAITFKLSEYTRKKENNQVFHSIPFYTHPNGYKMCMRIDADGVGAGAGTHLSVFMNVLEGHSDTQLHWPFLGTITCELLNLMAEDKHHVMVLILYTGSDMYVGSSRGHPKFIPHSSLSHNPASNPQYLHDDTLYFRVSVQVDHPKPWLVYTDKSNSRSITTIREGVPLGHEDPVTFNVSSYNERRETNNRFYSPPFYTYPCGYLFRTEVDVHSYGSGLGTHISVFAKLLEGAYDASLSWPFMGTVTFILLNLLADDNHHSWTFTCGTTDHAHSGNVWGKSQFIPHSALYHDPVKNTQYLKNDTPYIRVTVMVNNHKYWLHCSS